MHWGNTWQHRFWEGLRNCFILWSWEKRRRRQMVLQECNDEVREIPAYKHRRVSNDRPNC